VNAGIEITLSVLSKATNESATAVLLKALESPHRAIQEGALRALTQRRSNVAEAELLKRWLIMSNREKEIVAQRTACLSTAIRDAVLGSDPELCKAGCEAALATRDYDLLPVFLTAATDLSSSNREQASATVADMAKAIYNESIATRDYSDRRDPQIVRRRAVKSLEESLGKDRQKRDPALLEAYLILVERSNPTLNRMLQSPREPGYEAAMRTLSTSERPGVMRLLLSFLDDHHAPAACIKAIACREDEPFVRKLLEKSADFSAQEKVNVKRLGSLSWLRTAKSFIDNLDEPLQTAAVALLDAANLSDDLTYKTLSHLLRFGKAGARRAAAVLLERFTSDDASQLALDTLDDNDPQVRANILKQLRARGIPGAITMLLEEIDAEHEVVRNAARGCLEEFNFERFVSSFDILDETVRESTGILVGKIDREAPFLLRKELKAPVRSRRLRALAMAVAMQLLDELEPDIIEMMADPDQFVRVEVVNTLALCPGDAARQVLRVAMLDRSSMVQDAAERELQRLAAAGVTIPQPAAEEG